MHVRLLNSDIVELQLVHIKSEEHSRHGDWQL